MTDNLPRILHTYQFHSADSTRWQSFEPRSDDVVIASSYKSGTTWIQEIVRQLIFAGPSSPERDDVSLGDVSPWIDAPGAPIDEVLARLRAQQHRRFVKTHLPLDGLPFYPQVSYILVGRDARDVAMSMWNMYSGFTEVIYEGNKSRGYELPLPPQDFHDFWHTWITRGLLEWESKGYPFGCNLRHTQSWWEYRHLPNILFVHYNDLKSDPASEVYRIAGFLEIPVASESMPQILNAVTLDSMRDREERLNPGMGAIFKDGAKTFFFKGTNGRWKNVLSADELLLYDMKADKVLTPDCRAWLEKGRKSLDWPSEQ